MALAVVVSWGAGDRSVSAEGSRLASGAGLSSLPAGARGPVSALLGADLVGYWVHGVVARNRGQGLSARFVRSGVWISSGSAGFEITLTGFGRGSTTRPVGEVLPRVVSNRVTYARGSLREWWANGPLGLEQGFVLGRRPGGAGPLTFALRVSARVRLVDGGLALPVGVRYGALEASDARGRPLRAWLSVGRGRVLVRVDDRGARYPVRIDPIVQRAKLTASNGADGDFLGFSVAVSGNTIVVGAPGANHSRGAVYVYEMPTTGWTNATQVAELTASDAGGDDELGTSVAASGDTIVAGAPKFGTTPELGAVYVFVMPATGWTNATQTAELSPSQASGVLGYAVAISGDTIVACCDGGGAAVYERPPGGWTYMTPTARLTVADAQIGGDQFVAAVAISGETIVVGAPDKQIGAHESQGEVDVFAMPASGWANMTQTAELTASNGATLDELGSAVAISGDTIVAHGAYNEEQAITNNGMASSPHQKGGVYVFVRPPGGWTNMTQTAELTASNGAPGDDLGHSVSVSGNVIVASDPFHSVGSDDAQGIVYVYVKPTAGWTNMTESNELIDGATRAELGYSVATAGNTVVAGAPFASGGAVYVSVAGGSFATRCAAESGPLQGLSLGRLRLGMSRAQARRAITRSARRGRRYQRFFCLMPTGVRAGFASPRLLRGLPARERRRLIGRIVWISTSSRFYAIQGVRPGTILSAAAKRLALRRPLRIGRNDWYLAPARVVTVVLKVRRRVVQEIGIADPQLTHGRQEDRTFMNSFH